MEFNYAYLGEVFPEECKAIVKVFPLIREIGTMGYENGKQLIALGIDADLPDDVIGLYQLIVSLWGDNEARQRAWDALEETPNIITSLQLENNILKHKVNVLQNKLDNITRILKD